MAKTRSIGFVMAPKILQGLGLMLAGLAASEATGSSNVGMEIRDGELHLSYGNFTPGSVEFGPFQQSYKTQPRKKQDRKAVGG